MELATNFCGNVKTRRSHTHSNVVEVIIRTNREANAFQHRGADSGFPHVSSKGYDRHAVVQ
jgi:hypothetical protein